MTIRVAQTAISVFLTASTAFASEQIKPADPVAGREHWAFQPLMRVVPPVTGNWSEGAIDRFVAKRRTGTMLKPVVDATRRELLRRVFFQLTGLPPTPDEVSAFLTDRQPDALVKVVDRLLASPRFGERWGRHWLDLARYADSNGLDENFLFREAWRYRNWVIDAMNEGVPFDRFVLEQIAGDKLPYESIAQRDRQRIASGFMVVGPKVLLGVNSNLQRMDVADEQLGTIGRTFLGLTLGCARCHDHKFEPVPTADYYAMVGILTSTKVMETRYMLGQQRLMEQLIGLGRDGERLDAEYENYWRELPKVKAATERAREARKFLQKKDEPGFRAFAEKNPDDVTDVARDNGLTFDQRIAAQNVLIAKWDAIIRNKPAIPPRAMVPVDVDEPGDEAVRKAGEFDKPARKVPRGFLRVLSIHAQAKMPGNASGRRELAEWLTNVETGAGTLTARVLANRIWHHLIGMGLVRTADNFGRTGERPSHPELLDYLAGELIDTGWSIKALVRQIVLSRTFSLGSGHDAKAHAIDPDNRLLWRAHRRRLDPESIRDGILFTAGELDLAQFKSTVSYLGDQATAVGKNENRRRTDFPCRSVYLPVIRNDLPEIFEAFDFADSHTTTGVRPRTSSATQGLFMLNDRSVRKASEALAGLLLKSGPFTDEARVEWLFELVLSDAPTKSDRSKIPAFVVAMEKRGSEEKEPIRRAWALTAHALWSSSRYQFLE